MIADRLLDEIDKKKTPCIVGLDPVIERIPKHLIEGESFRDVANAFMRFNREIIDSVADLVPAVKPQIAFYEKYGSDGLSAFKDTVDYAKSKGLIVIEDGKRNDIGTTSQAYADGHLGKVKTKSMLVPSLDLDLLTVNPYLVTDGLTPFVNVCKTYGKGIFILVKTSNPSSGELQDRFVILTDEEEEELKALGINLESNQTELYNLVALQVNLYAQTQIGKRGYSAIGAVVGATYPKQAETLRKIMPKSIFLAPGYGSQGAKGKDLVNLFNPDGYGAVINNSSGINYAYEKHNDPQRFAHHARQATKEMINDVNEALKKAGKLPRGWN